MVPELENSLRVKRHICAESGGATEQAQELGKPVSTKTDEFPENFRTAFDPPSAPFSENYIAIFPQTGCAGTEFAMKFFRSEMIPLPSPPLSKFFPDIHDQNCRF